MKKSTNSFYLVCEDILPEAIKKTIRVKALLKRGDARTINEAVEKMNLSRSAYYKYKDYVFPFYEASKNKVITFTFLLENEKGVLEAMEGHHDDLLMTRAIGLYICFHEMPLPTIRPKQTRRTRSRRAVSAATI